jgi:hypothetical protein
VSSAKNAEYENALPVPRWQSRHAQACVIFGGAETVAVRPPQVHDAIFG